jgi:twitching motility two-component system response regulator PilH
MAIKKILVVDDTSIYLEQMKQILVNEGYDVIAAASGKEALEKAKTSHPDLIFMDVVMPEMDGFAACRELTKNANTKQIPVIFVSSKNTEADRVWAELQGAKAYITKPYTAEQILDQVEAFNW